MWGEWGPVTPTNKAWQGSESQICREDDKCGLSLSHISCLRPHQSRPWHRDRGAQGCRFHFLSTRGLPALSTHRSAQRVTERLELPKTGGSSCFPKILCILLQKASRSGLWAYIWWSESVSNQGLCSNSISIKKQ